MLGSILKGQPSEPVHKALTGLVAERFMMGIRSRPGATEEAPAH
jgi:hypothetical protein